MSTENWLKLRQFTAKLAYPDEVMRGLYSKEYLKARASFIKWVLDYSFDEANTTESLQAILSAVIDAIAPIKEFIDLMED